jgi:hypothetical protein
MVFLHALIQRAFFCEADQFELIISNLSIWSIILIFPVVYISLWGSSFIFLSGASVAYVMGGKVKKNPSEIKSFLKKRIISSFLLYLVYLIQKIFFNAQTSVNPYPTHSLLTGALETGEINFPELIHIITSDTLEMLAFVGLFLSLLFYFLWKTNGFDAKKTIRILFILGISLFGLTILLQTLIGDPALIKSNLVNEKHYLAYYYFLRIYAERFAILPVLAFSFFGAIFGIKLANGASFKEIAKFGFTTGGILIGIFLLQLILGFDIVSGFAYEMTPWPLQFNVIGSQIITLTILLRIFDFNKKPYPKHRTKTASFLKKYSNISLTIYIFEPVISQTVFMVFFYFNGGPIYTNFPLILLFVSICMGIWMLITLNWAKIKNVGSFEWLMMKGKQWILKGLGTKFGLRKLQKTPQMVKI